MPNETPRNRAALAKFWAEPGLFAFNALTAFIDTFGTEALTWHPATIEMDLRDEFGVDVDDGNFDRLMTAIHILTTDGFFTSPVDFVRGCCSLSGHLVSSSSMLLPDCDDIAWGITEGMLINKPDRDEPFTEEIVGYIKEALKEEGVLNPPDVLRIAAPKQNLMDQVSYEFSDDPEMFKAVQDTETDRSEGIKAFVKTRLHNMLEQLKRLPLHEGKNAAAVNKLQAGMERKSNG